MAATSDQSPVADPGPLGLGAFALTTFVLSASNAKLLPPEAAPAFLGAALFYGGLAQLLAGMWEFRKNNTFGATAFSSYGAFWLALASMVIMEAMGIIKFGDARGAAVGTFLIAWTVFTFYMFIGSLRVNTAVTLVFLTLLITYLLLDLAEFGVLTSVPGGYMGLICAFCAWYASAAGVINSVAGREVLPVGSRAKAGK
ncbi:MAG: acetate uptake transporter [Clostridia bacterium]|nr:acetate uptake transporter [Clostridia bacterium]MDH7572868.1 acetate uptake transporter [Clostridia bacterium]